MRKTLVSSQGVAVLIEAVRPPQTLLLLGWAVSSVTVAMANIIGILVFRDGGDLVHLNGIWLLYIAAGSLAQPAGSHTNRSTFCHFCGLQLRCFQAASLDRAVVHLRDVRLFTVLQCRFQGRLHRATDNKVDGVASSGPSKMNAQLNAAVGGLKTLQWLGNGLWLVAVTLQVLKGARAVRDPDNNPQPDPHRYKFTVSENLFMILQYLALLLMLWHSWIPKDAAHRPVSRTSSPFPTPSSSRRGGYRSLTRSPS